METPSYTFRREVLCGQRERGGQEEHEEEMIIKVVRKGQMIMHVSPFDCPARSLVSKHCTSPILINGFSFSLL